MPDRILTVLSGRLWPARCRDARPPLSRLGLEHTSGRGCPAPNARRLVRTSTGRAAFDEQGADPVGEFVHVKRLYHMPGKASLARTPQVLGPSKRGHGKGRIEAQPATRRAPRRTGIRQCRAGQCRRGSRPAARGQASPTPPRRSRSQPPSSPACPGRWRPYRGRRRCLRPPRRVAGWRKRGRCLCLRWRRDGGQLDDETRTPPRAFAFRPSHAPCNSTSDRTIDRPMPMPLGRDAPADPCTKGANKRGRSSGSMPTPESSTLNCTLSPRRCRRAVTRPPGGVNLSAFDNRLIAT